MKDPDVFLVCFQDEATFAIAKQSQIIEEAGTPTTIGCQIKVKHGTKVYMATLMNKGINIMSN
jgi:hypothetical protein